MFLRLFALLLVPALASTWSAQQPAPTILVPGAEAIERDLPAGGTATFGVVLAAGQATRIDLHQIGADLALRVLAPDGRVLVDQDGSVITKWEEATIIADEAGTYTVEVTSSRFVSPTAGNFTILIDPLQDVTPTLREHARAERLTHAGSQKGREGTKESLVESVKLYDEAIAIWETLPESSFDLADTLNVAGERVFALGRVEDAGKYFERALPAWRAAKQRGGEGQTLNNLGVINRVLGDLPKALEYMQLSLEARRETKDRYGEGQTLSNMASIHAFLEDYHTALDLLREALPIRREVGDVRGEATTLHVIGGQHFALGDYEQAYRYALEALPLRQKVVDQPGEAYTLDALGLAQRARGNVDEALGYFRAALALRIAGGDVLGEAATRHNLGQVLADKGEPGAFDEFERALALARQSKDRRIEGDALHSIGEWYSRRNDPARARDAFEQALVIRRQLADASHEAATLRGLAALARPQDPQEARRLLERSIELIESVHRRVARDDLRATLLASRQPHFEAYVDVLLDLHAREPQGGYDAAALVASDRARARNLRELLADARIPVSEGVPAALRDQEMRTRRQLQIKESERARVFGQSPTGAAAQRVDQEVATALSGYREVLGELRRVSPRYVALTETAPVSLDAIRKLLGDDTVALAYWLGADRSAAFVISRDSLRVAVLPEGRVAIEAAARRVHEALSQGPSVVNAGQQQRAQDALAAMILRPVAHWLSRPRIVVIPDGALQYVPFAVLSLPGAAAGRPLVADKELVQAPSLSVLVALDEEAVATRAGTKRVAVLADPVLDAQDVRVATARRSTPAVARPVTPLDEDLLRSAAGAGLPSFPRLPHTREEATAIQKLAPGAVRLSLDFDASRGTALDRQLADFDIVHIAAHGLVNAARPELSGIVLSLVDAKGQPQDGFLRVHDIFNMKLGADLVVLSACRTALGADIRGEGLVGLTRGFMYAGAPRVVASLWDVRDRSTAELMTRFYRGMLTGGLTPAAALRAAQRSMWEEPQWRHPSHWGAFLLQGSWK